MDDRLARQIDFVVEIDRLKTVLRRSYLTDVSRRENSAEHSWHLALMVIALAEYADQPIHVGHTIRLVLVHDLVEIDAGDTYIYDAAGQADRAEREQLAADRIFGLLPADQAAVLRALWDEFEHSETPEARFARALDRLQPVLLNLAGEGCAWREHGVGLAQVMAVNQRMAHGAARLWEYARARLEQAGREGWLDS